MRLVLAIMGVLLPSLALACPPIKGERVDANVVAAFQKLAEKMQTPCAAHFTLDGKGGAMVEYLPEGESLDTWKNMMTANLIYTGKSSSDVVVPMASKMVETYQKAGGKAEIVGKADGGAYGPLLGVRYEVGEGAQKEHAIAIVRTIADDKVVVLHRQRRGSDLSPEEVELFKSSNGIR